MITEIWFVSPQDRFANIRILSKRCEHFLGRAPKLISPHDGFKDRNDWLYVPFTGRAEGMGIAAHNYSDMLSLDMLNSVHLVCWLEASAASFNRFIDSNQIANDAVAKSALRWWRNFLFFFPENLREKTI